MYFARVVHAKVDVVVGCRVLLDASSTWTLLGGVSCICYLKAQVHSVLKPWKLTELEGMCHEIAPHAPYMVVRTLYEHAVAKACPKFKVIQYSAW